MSVLIVILRLLLSVEAVMIFIRNYIITIIIANQLNIIKEIDAAICFIATNEKIHYISHSNVICVSIACIMLLINNHITMTIITISNQSKIIINNINTVIGFIATNEKIHYVSGVFIYVFSFFFVSSYNQKRIGQKFPEFYGGVCLFIFNCC